MTKANNFTAATQALAGQTRAAKFNKGAQAINLAKVFEGYGIVMNGQQNGGNEM